ncbi:hypothetical protein JCM10207_003773 [Rhodosporidiobolus poonsookiae]
MSASQLTDKQLYAAETFDLFEQVDNTVVDCEDHGGSTNERHRLHHNFEGKWEEAVFERFAGIIDGTHEPLSLTDKWQLIAEFKTLRSSLRSRKNKDKRLLCTLTELVQPDLNSQETEAKYPSIAFGGRTALNAEAHFVIHLVAKLNEIRLALVHKKVDIRAGYIALHDDDFGSIRASWRLAIYLRFRGVINGKYTLSPAARFEISRELDSLLARAEDGLPPPSFFHDPKAPKHAARADKLIPCIYSGGRSVPREASSLSSLFPLPPSYVKLSLSQAEDYVRAHLDRPSPATHAAMDVPFALRTPDGKIHTPSPLDPNADDYFGTAAVPAPGPEYHARARGNSTASVLASRPSSSERLRMPDPADFQPNRSRGNSASGPFLAVPGLDDRRGRHRFHDDGDERPRAFTPGPYVAELEDTAAQPAPLRLAHRPRRE